ncbi:MAG: hypothetical protein BIFFINMI_02490 [Phycisphaerae bacterium]|nr:hypothetical protein [Phycisphaerae bacterium]
MSHSSPSRFASALALSGLLGLAVGMLPLLAASPNDAAPEVSNSPTSQRADSQPASAADSDDEARTANRRRHEQYRRLAGPLAAVTFAAIALVTVAMVVWILHWGRVMRRAPHADRSQPPQKSQPGPDPWAAAGERFRMDDDSGGPVPPGQETP